MTWWCRQVQTRTRYKSLTMVLCRWAYRMATLLVDAEHALITEKTCGLPDGRGERRPVDVEYALDGEVVSFISPKATTTVTNWSSTR